MSGLRVLIVDDEPSIRECLAAFLEMRGDEVTTTAETSAAWLALQEPVHYDVLVCDGLNGDGPRLLRAVRNHFPRVRTILYSANDALVEQEQQLGYAALLKGDSWQELLVAIDGAGMSR